MSTRAKMAVVIAVLLVFHGVTLLAGFFAPYDPAEQDRSAPFAPPSRLHFFDASGNFHLRPVVNALTADADSFGSYKEDLTRSYPLHFFVRGPEYEIAGGIRSNIHLFGIDPPGKLFLLGTDGYGRDQFSRLVFGGRISMLAGVLATILALALGTTIGAGCGFYGRTADEAVMRFAELFLAVPWLYLLFAVRAFLPLHISASSAFLLVVVVIGAVGWARPARLVRGIVLSAKERNYVLAARGFGASNFYLLRRHVLPQTYGVVLTQAALLVPQYILAEVTLSFLGLGVSEPLPSWGNMLGSLQQYHILVSYWWMLAPLAILVPLFMAYSAAADLLQQRLSISG
jgi:peptide/nickel transport system permease protein